MTTIEDGKPGRRGRRRLAQRRKYRRSRVGRPGPAPAVYATPLVEEGAFRQPSAGAGGASRRQATLRGNSPVTFHRADTEGTER
jgi:hypothetical protein